MLLYYRYYLRDAFFMAIRFRNFQDQTFITLLTRRRGHNKMVWLSFFSQSDACTKGGRDTCVLPLLGYLAYTYPLPKPDTTLSKSLIKPKLRPFLTISKTLLLVKIKTPSMNIEHTISRSHTSPRGPSKRTWYMLFLWSVCVLSFPIDWLVRARIRVIVAMHTHTLIA